MSQNLELGTPLDDHAIETRYGVQQGDDWLPVYLERRANQKRFETYMANPEVLSAALMEENNRLNGKIKAMQMASDDLVAGLEAQVEQLKRKLSKRAVVATRPIVETTLFTVRIPDEPDAIKKAMQPLDALKADGWKVTHEEFNWYMGYQNYSAVLERDVAQRRDTVPASGPSWFPGGGEVIPRRLVTVDMGTHEDRVKAMDAAAVESGVLAVNRLRGEMPKVPGVNIITITGSKNHGQ